jgi:hypothetical protein
VFTDPLPSNRRPIVGLVDARGNVLPSRCIEVGLYVTILMTDIRYAMYIDLILKHSENTITAVTSRLGVQNDIGSVAYLFAVYLNTLLVTQK